MPIWTSPKGGANNAAKAETVDISSTDHTATIVADEILVGVAGDVVGRLLDDSADRTFKLPAGIHRLRFKKITKTNTTATNLILLKGR